MDLFLQKLHLQSSILRYPPSLLGFEGQGPGSAMQNRDLSLLSARAPTKEGLFHPQRAEMRPPQTKPSSWDASVPELLVILFSTSWKLFEKNFFFFFPRQKSNFKSSDYFPAVFWPAQATSNSIFGEREREEETTQIYCNPNLFSLGEPTEQCCRLCTSYWLLPHSNGSDL